MQGGTQPSMQGTGAETAGTGSGMGATQPLRQGGSQTATASPDASGTAGGQTGAQAGSQQMATGQTGARPGGQSGEQMAALEVESQPLKDGKVKIDLAYMAVDGFVAIHEVQDGKLLPDAVGYAPLKAEQEAQNIEVSLDKQVPADTEVVAVLHRDTGKKGEFEFDARTMNEDGPELIAGRPIAAAFLITSPDSSQRSGSQQQSGSQQPATMPQDDGSTAPASN